MPSKYRSTFFDEPREASRIKLRLLEKYLVPWTAKVGSTAPGGRLCVVDGFAGQGDYDDGTPGSPRLILDQARAAGREYGYRIGCVFVDMKNAHATKLKALCRQYEDVEGCVIHGDFWKNIDEIRRLVDGRPLLTLVDPFGVKSLDYERIGILVNGSRKCDLVVTFVDSAAARIAGSYPLDIAKAIGPRKDDEEFAATFARNMASKGRFLAGGRFPIHQSIDREKKYELVVFSRSHHAYELWNNFMTTEWRKQRTARTHKQFPPQRALAGMAEWADASDAQEDVANAADEMLAWLRLRANPSFTRIETIREFVVHRFAAFNTSTLKRGLTLLEDRGSVSCESKVVRNIDQRRWRLTDAPL
jgi:hypothetical protein